MVSGCQENPGDCLFLEIQTYFTSTQQHQLRLLRSLMALVQWVGSSLKQDQRQNLITTGVVSSQWSKRQRWHLQSRKDFLILMRTSLVIHQKKEKASMILQAYIQLMVIHFQSFQLVVRHCVVHLKPWKRYTT